MNPNTTDPLSLEGMNWELFAVAGPGSTNNARYSFTLGDWTVQDHSRFMIFGKKFCYESRDEEIYSAVGDLEHILLALFVNDHVPRQIFYFWYPTSLEKDLRLRLLFMLGQTRSTLQPDSTMLTQSFSQNGWIFNHKTDWPVDVIPTVETITDWFDVLRRNESIAESVGIFQDAFSTVNRMYGQYRYYDYRELASAFILMVSGLESLFLSQSDDHADIAFKFKVVGTAFYTKYVAEDFLNRFAGGTRKLSAAEFMSLLGTLYSLRSKIAHGKARSLFVGKQAKHWKPVFEAFHVEWKEPEDRSIFFSHLLLALGLLEKHILALIFCAREHLDKGVRIVDELF